MQLDKVKTRGFDRLDLLTTLKEKILIADGAMGTLLYSHGVDRCFEELNVTHPEEIFHTHRAYVEAGANVIQTNTYSANYIKLARYGLEDKVKEINTQAVKIAKRAANKDTFVVGTIGGIRGSQKNLGTIEEIKRIFREQLYCLLLEGVDGLLLETYYSLEELTTVLAIAREATNLPIITNISMHEIGLLENGTPLNDALTQLDDAGADIVGVNCRLGPHYMIESLKTVALPKTAYLSAYPNASLPAYSDGKLIYNNNPDYFEQCAREFRNQGVRLFGGCCGTTPEHIVALKKGVEGFTPLLEKTDVKHPPIIEVQEPAARKKLDLAQIVTQRHSIIVELDPPRNLQTKEYLKGVQALKDIGVDAITLADNSLATPRISNLAMATLMKQQRIAITPLLHLTCRDRNLIGLQSHLMGLHTLGIHEILAITGDPTKIGGFPGASSVFDATSFELIKLIKQCNEGISFSGKSLKEKTSFRIAAAFNPNVHHLDKAVRRLEKKIDCGADYFLTQPIYQPEQIESLKQATKHIKQPIYIGIMPLTSSRNAEFLHHEVPGMKLTDDVRQRMKATGDNRILAEQEGMSVAKELIDVAFEHFNGIYLVTPFMRYDITVKLSSYIKQKVENAQEIIL